MKIAVDFDGTCVSHNYPDMGQDAPGAVETLKELSAAGHTLFLNTMRSGQQLADAVDWFISRGIPLHGINNDPAQFSWTVSTKCYADLYIDDAAFGAPLIEMPGAEDFRRKVLDWSVVADKLLTLKSAAEKAME